MARTKTKKTLAQKIKENGNKPRAKSKYAQKQLEKRRKQREQE